MIIYQHSFIPTTTGVHGHYSSSVHRIICEVLQIDMIKIDEIYLHKLMITFYMYVNQAHESSLVDMKTFLAGNDL